MILFLSVQINPYNTLTLSLHSSECFLSLNSITKILSATRKSHSHWKDNICISPPIPRPPSQNEFIFLGAEKWHKRKSINILITEPQRGCKEKYPRVIWRQNNHRKVHTLTHTHNTTYKYNPFSRISFVSLSPMSVSVICFYVCFIFFISFHVQFENFFVDYFVLEKVGEKKRNNYLLYGF